MSSNTGVAQPNDNHLPVKLEGLDSLAELALDMRWSWNHRTDKLWRMLDPTLWELTQNPWVVLQTVSRDHLAGLLADATFRTMVDKLVDETRKAAATPAWFQQNHSGAGLRCVAYFSMEFMLSEALPIYSGGLGNVAGDQLKTASDLGVPVVGIGLLYQQGYFRQLLDKQGAQQALYPYNDPGQLPIVPLRHPNGEWLRLELALPGFSVWLRTWEVQVGRVKLYLLDSNDAANYPAHRGITSELYGGDPELRLKQELLLGIGGWRLLAALGIEPEVCHLNEGHAAFAVLERARSFMQQSGQSFHVALEATRAGNLFTTHTAVEAGFDRFPPGMITQYLGCYAEKELGLSIHDLLALGRQNPNDESESFNMAYLAVRGSGAVNAVSRLHGEVSRALFQPLFPRWPQDEVPIGHVTNGVHMPTWDSAPADDLWTETCGKDRWLGTTENLGKNIRRTTDASLWKFRLSASNTFVEFARTRLSNQLAAAGASTNDVEFAKQMFDPNTLTIGFARRFATYKRTNLLLRDPQRLLRLLTNPQRPVQLILAGKAHPADRQGQALIQEWTRFIRRADVRPHAMFLSDYDMHLTEHLVQGVDVWLNTPRRPWEACGTSGMKVLVNGGLNLSVLDGWWAEAYEPELGWALEGAQSGGSDADTDVAEVEALFDLLEDKVVPEFYARDERGIPVAWVARIRESMARLTPQFSSNRTVREYTEKHYLPAAEAYRLRAADKGASSKAIVDWKDTLRRNWGALHVGEVKAQQQGESQSVEAQVWFHDIEPKDILVQLYANQTSGQPSVALEMNRVTATAVSSGFHLYRVTVPASRSLNDYTVRAMPRHEALAIPLEDAGIVWQR